MKMKQAMIVMSVMVMVLGMTTVAVGQGRGRGSGLCYRQIQVQSPVMIEGTIEKIETFNYGRGRYGSGLHLFVRENGQETEVHLGPQGWLSDQGLQLKPGDAVKVKAFKGTLYNGTPFLFAAEVSGLADGKTFMLRDKDGFPLWRQSLRGGQGRGPRSW